MAPHEWNEHPFEEELAGSNSSEVKPRFRFSITDPMLQNLTGNVEDGATTTYYGYPFLNQTPWTYPVAHGPTPVFNVNHTRRIFLLNASVSGSTNLSTLNPKPSWFTQTSTWLSTALATPALELTPTLDRRVVYVNDFNFGASSAAYIDFTFVVRHDVTFDWTRYRVTFSNSTHQDYFTPPSTVNPNFYLQAGQSIIDTDAMAQTSEFCRLEQKVLRVYIHKNEITQAFSTDTRITFGQPDTTGSVPVPDPNEPSQHLDFSESTYGGGLFIGQATSAGPQPDRSGKSIAQIIAPVEANGTKTTLSRAIALYNPDYATGYGYETGARDVYAVHPDTTNETLAQILARPKRWGTRWPVAPLDPDPEGPGDPAFFSKTTVQARRKLYTWLVSPVQGITGNSQLVALYTHELGPNVFAPMSTPWWRYFWGPKYFTSAGFSGGAKDLSRKPRAWTISYSPLSTTSPVLSQYNLWSE